MSIAGRGRYRADVTRIPLAAVLSSCLALQLPPGSLPVGFRTVPIDAPAGRPGRVHFWYPARACETPLRYGDYVRLPGGSPGDLASELKRGHSTPAAPISDE